MELPRLYNRDSEGRIQVWYAQVTADTAGAIITTFSGLLEGTHTPHTTTVTKGKNIGKVNATDAYGQALNDARSKWEDKRKKGYKSLEDLGLHSLTEENVQLYNEQLIPILEDKLPKFNTDANNNLKPMKAQPYYKDNGGICIKFPCGGQPKINGVRCVADWVNGRVEFRSKEGVSYLETTRHIAEHFAPEDFTNDYVFDGELYIHGLYLQQIASAAKKMNLNSPRLEFRCFDLSIPTFNQDERTGMLYRRLLRFTDGHAPIKIVPLVFPVRDDAHAQQLTDQWIAEGYEGGIFRDMTALYQFGKRPKTMTKLKRLKDGEFEIVDVIESDSNPGVAIFTCKNDINDETFNVNPEGTDEIKREYFTNRENYIGKLGTVEYRERTAPPREVPFHAVFKTVRDYE